MPRSLNQNVCVVYQKHQEDALSAMMLVRRYLNKPGLAVRVRLRGQPTMPQLQDNNGAPQGAGGDAA